MPILLLFFIWFIAEIAGFIYIGGYFGIGETIVEIILSIIIGSWIIRRSIASVGNIALIASVGIGSVISNVLGGILLVIPGFLSDFMGLLLLLNFPINVILLILGLGRKPDINSFMRNRMGGMAGMGGMGQNPFGGGQNPFADMHKQQNNQAGGQPKNPFEGNPIFEEMLKKQQQNQQMNNDTSAKDTIIEGEVINKDDKDK
ncbi:MAG: FxsA family protein [Alphaproteobacteria bacterium]